MIYPKLNTELHFRLCLGSALLFFTVALALVGALVWGFSEWGLAEVEKAPMFADGKPFETWDFLGTVFLASMIAPLLGIPGVTATMSDNVIGHQPFGVQISVDESVTGISLHDIVATLKEGDPPIWTRVRDDEEFIMLHGFGLNEDEDKIVGKRIAELLRK